MQLWKKPGGTYEKTHEKIIKNENELVDIKYSRNLK